MIDAWMLFDQGCGPRSTRRLIDQVDGVLTCIFGLFLAVAIQDFSSASRSGLSSSLARRSRSAYALRFRT